METFRKIRNGQNEEVELRKRSSQNYASQNNGSSLESVFQGSLTQTGSINLMTKEFDQEIRMKTGQQYGQ